MSQHIINDYLKAEALYQQGKHAKAKPILLKIVRQIPDHFEALRLLGYVAGVSGDYQGAIKYLSRGLDVNPSSVESWYYRGFALQKLNQHEKAAACFAEALRLHPSLFEGLHDTGLSLSQLQRFDEALTFFDKALAVDRLSWTAHYNRALALGSLKRYEEEIAGYDQALSLNPGDPRVMVNRGVALGELSRYAEAVEWLDRSLALEPHNPVAPTSRGAALGELARYDEAIESHTRALKLKPDYAEAHFNRALISLLQGDFENGWNGYEWRWKTREYLGQRTHPGPRWSGKQSLQGKRILIHAEQGFGDTLQFCRYVKLVAGLGAEVILEVQPPLKRLMSTLAGVHQIIARGEPLPEFDFHCPLLSLPLAFNTRLATIPGVSGYIQPSPGSVSEWRAKLKNDGAKRIGIAWAGSLTNSNDRSRSLPLEMLLPFAQFPITLVSLQKDLRAEDRALLDSRPDILRFEEQIRDFADTAALIESLDLVITVDTSIAHLAGAMGKPLWILLPYHPDFRWLLNRDDSPWYPSARLIRQPAIGDWHSVISRTEQQLRLECPVD